MQMQAIEDNFKGVRNPTYKLFYKKELLYKPWIMIPVLLIKSLEKMEKLWAFECLQMDCNGSSHTVGFVTSHSLIKYV